MDTAVDVLIQPTTMGLAVPPSCPIELMTAMPMAERLGPRIAGGNAQKSPRTAYPQPDPIPSRTTLDTTLLDANGSVVYAATVKTASETKMPAPFHEIVGTSPSRDNDDCGADGNSAAEPADLDHRSSVEVLEDRRNPEICAVKERDGAVDEGKKIDLRAREGSFDLAGLVDFGIAVIGAQVFRQLSLEVRCDTTSDGMLFSFEELIAYISRDETLMPGEFIGSGTVGNGCGLEIGRFLEDGDTVELEIEKIGKLANTVRRRN